MDFGHDDYKTVWENAKQFKGNMNLNDFQNFFLTLMFYRIASEKVLKINKDFESENYKYENLRFLQEIKLGFFIDEARLYNSLLEDVYEYNIVERIEEALREISIIFKEYHYNKLDYDLLNIRKIESDIKKRNNMLRDLLYVIDSGFLYLSGKTNIDLGVIFSRFIEFTSYSIRTTSADICSPSIIIKLITKIIKSSVKNFEKVYDPTFGTGLLVMNIVNGMSNKSIYGHEINIFAYNIAMMNMILNNHIRHELVLGDCLSLDMNNKEEKYDIVVSHPPFNMKWDNNEWFYHSKYKFIPPKNSANYAFIIKMLEKLDENGVMAILLPQGVLFRGNTEYLIRKNLIEKNLLDAVISLPKNLMYKTSIPISLLIFKKNKIDNKVFFIDESSRVLKTKISDLDIEKINKVYQRRESISYYSKDISLNEIRKCNYNLNVHKYIDVFKIEMLMKNYRFEKYELNKIAVVRNFSENLDKNSIIINSKNCKIGNYDENSGQKYNNYISVKPNNKYVSSEYLRYFFSTHICKVIFESISINGRRISLAELKKLEIPIPKKEIQERLVKSENQISATINKLIDYRDRLVNNPNEVGDLTFKLEELQNALNINNRIDRIKKEISCGESLHIEFKRDFNSCEEKIIRTICAFLNTEGGRLYIGVDNNGSIVGLNLDDNTKTTDNLVMDLKNKFRDNIPGYLVHADIEVLNIDRKIILLVNCEKSKIPVFRKKKDKKYFYIRKFASTETISDIEHRDSYINKNF